MLSEDFGVSSEVVGLILFTIKLHWWFCKNGGGIETLVDLIGWWLWLSGGDIVYGGLVLPENICVVGDWAIAEIGEISWLPVGGASEMLGWLVDGVVCDWESWI